MADVKELKQMTQTVVRDVDNRTLILGIDELYRSAMATFEVDTLLPAARTLMRALNVEPSDVPIEGYYTESIELADFFKSMRALQGVQDTRRPEVANLADFEQLLSVTASPIFGVPGENGSLFPVMRNPLYFALEDTQVDLWNIDTLTQRAQEIARQKDVCSLVGLAALAGDPVLLTALSESTVLYSARVAGAAPVVYEYKWCVDEEIARAANRFISIFNELAGSDIRRAGAENATYFYHAAKNNQVAGRCVRIGYDDRTTPYLNYHWAIGRKDGEEAAEDFWDAELWTSERFRNERLYKRGRT